MFHIVLCALRCFLIIYKENPTSEDMLGPFVLGKIKASTLLQGLYYSKAAFTLGDTQNILLSVFTNETAVGSGCIVTLT